MSIPKLKLDIEQLITEISGKYEIISASYIGSFNDEIDLNSLKDIDIYIVINPLNKIIYEDVVAQFKQITEAASKEYKKSFPIEVRSGGFKTEDDNACQIHLLIDNLEECQRTANVIKLCWSRKNTPILGKHLHELLNPMEIDKEYLVRKYGGIRPFIKDIHAGIIPYTEWTFLNENSPKERKRKSDLTPFELLTFLECVCKASLANTIQYREWKEHKREFSYLEKDVLSYSENKFKEQYQFIQRLYQRKLEGKQEITKDRAIFLLEYLIEKVKEGC